MKKLFGVATLLILASAGAQGKDNLSGLLLYKENESVAHQQSRWVIRDLDGGRTIELPWARDAGWASLSPDGTRIAFASGGGPGKTKVNVGSWVDGHFRAINLPQWQVRKLTWAADEQKVFLEHGFFDIARATFSSYGLKIHAELRVSPDQRHVATFFYSDPTDIGIYGFEDQRQLDKIAKATSQPAWSPGSDAVVFTRKSALVIYDVASKTEHNLIDLKSKSQFPAEPAFSPDGSKIAFCIVARENIPRDFAGTYSDLYVINRDGTGKRKLFGGCSPSWAGRPRPN